MIGNTFCFVFCFKLMARGVRLKKKKESCGIKILGN